MLEDSNPDENGFFNRLDEAQAGLITWSQFWFPIDMIKKNRKRRLMDSDGLIKDMREMSEEAHAKLITDGAVGFGKNYRFILLDANEKSRIETIVRTSLVKGGAKKVLDITNSLGLVTVDDNQDMVSTFLTTNAGAMHHNFKSFSGSTNDKTDDILAFLAGMQ